MAKSQRLRLDEVRDVFRLLGECRDLGVDPAAWRRHALSGLCRLAGAESANGGEARWDRREGPFEIILPVDSGFSPAQLALYGEFMRDYGPADPLIVGAMRRMAPGVSTQPRSRLIDERVWRRSAFFPLYRAAEQCHDLFSIVDVAATDTTDAIVLHRGPGRPDFGGRERRVVRLFHAEAAPLIGGFLGSARGSALVQLSPRRRQTLDLLLAGEGEKQIASRLGLSRSTVHGYVTDLYGLMGVSSRAGLLALFVRRLPPYRSGPSER